MKILKKISAFVILILLRMPNLLAQDEGTYIDNLNIQDSSYLQQDALAGAESASGSNTTVIIIVAVVVIAVVAFLILRKKKK
ncbi:MAG: LPXTG cell wall anchor domain-containing protein [Prolixibacteraceae bacterium]|nr:LPXTG cell wall anchor domain-containing protein [Prolixibacteraceae bacterium]